MEDGTRQTKLHHSLITVIALVAFIFPCVVLWGVDPQIPLLLGCAAGCLAATLLMIPANYVILHLQYGMSVEAVSASMIYVIPFNLLKTVLNCAISLLLYEPVRRALEKILKIGE